MKTRLKYCLVVFLWAAFGPHTHGAVVQNPSVSGLNDEMGGSMYIDPVAGYDFTPVRPINVDYLGVYDDASNGLTAYHWVGLFIRQTGETLATARIDNNSILENTIRWELVPRVSLQPGIVYNIASFDWIEDRVASDWAFNLQMSPDITAVQGYIEVEQPGLHMPTRRGGPGAVFLGPAFGTAVPEPTTVGLIVGGLVLITMRKLRANRPTCESQRAQIVNNFLRG